MAKHSSVGWGLVVALLTGCSGAGPGPSTAAVLGDGGEGDAGSATSDPPPPTAQSDSGGPSTGDGGPTMPGSSSGGSSGGSTSDAGSVDSGGGGSSAGACVPANFHNCKSQDPYTIGTVCAPPRCVAPGQQLQFLTEEALTPPGCVDPSHFYAQCDASGSGSTPNPNLTSLSQQPCTMAIGGLCYLAELAASPQQ